MKPIRVFAAMSMDPQPRISRRTAVKTVAGLSLGAMLLPGEVSKALAADASASNRLVDVVWNFGGANDPLSTWTKDQAVGLARKLCGRQPKIATDLGGSLCILVGTVGNNRFVKEAASQGLVNLTQHAEDDYALTSARLRGSDVLFITGKNPRSVMYGVFAFFEHLGCRFLISRDVLPPSNPDLAIPALDVFGHTVNNWRGIWIQFCFATNDCMSLRDYEALFDQMAKLRMNRIMFYCFENEPFIDYSYHGERKVVGDISHPTSGYLSYGRRFAGSYLVKDIPVGREKFDRKHVAPLEFQDVESSDDALDRGKMFIRRLISLAKARGIGTWISFEPSFVSLNITKYTRPMPRPHEHWSGLVSCTDPVVNEINRNRIENLVESYPELEGILLNVPEGHYLDPYPDTRKLIEREWDNYAEVLRLTKNEHALRANIPFVEVVKHTVKIAKEVKPDVRLGITAVCKAALLTHLDQVLPKDMPFVDIESGSLWGGNPLHLFQRMQGRECAIVPRAVDDGSLAGLQFDLNLYHRDQFLQSNRRNGTSGFIIQLTHVRGNEHNVKYLAEGLWNDQLMPDEFYQDYARAIVGPEAAGLMVQAFGILEENEVFLGGRGGSNMPWNQTPLEIEALRAVPAFNLPYHRSPIAIKRFQDRSERFRKSMDYLQRAGKLFAQAAHKATPSGQRELRYLSHRNLGYIHHLQTLAMMADVYASWHEALASRQAGVEAVRDKLRKTVTLARQAEKGAIQSASEFAECVEHPTDLGVLWMINKSMVIGTRILGQHLENILAFYNGKEYWKKVDWELLFGTNPYPTTAVSPDEEPG